MAVYHRQLLVHLLFNQRDLVLLLDRLRLRRSIRVQDVHRFKVERANRPHERFLKILLHHSLHLVALTDLHLCII